MLIFAAPLVAAGYITHSPQCNFGKNNARYYLFIYLRLDAIFYSLQFLHLYIGLLTSFTWNYYLNLYTRKRGTSREYYVIFLTGINVGNQLFRWAIIGSTDALLWQCDCHGVFHIIGLLLNC